MTSLVEFVPNVSEGRDPDRVARLGRALAVDGLKLLDTHSDRDHNRSVFTLVGSLPHVEESMLEAAALAVREIDLTRHAGAHPRVGVLDVAPIVPLRATGSAECVEAALQMGEQLWERLGVPVYYYGDAARRESRRRLEAIRKFGFEKLRSLVRDGRALPDVGGPLLHPTAGACCVGVRKLMAAFNVLLRGRDLAAAKSIAAAIRESGGGLPGVKALGLKLASARSAQVSMNLTDLDRTPVHVAYRAVLSEAHKCGVPVLGSELVGLVPRAALGPEPEALSIAGFRPGMLLDEHIDGWVGRTRRMPRPAD